MDTIPALEQVLSQRGIAIEIVAPMAPHPCKAGVAWLAGDQVPLGRAVGFARLDAIIATDGLDVTPPKVLGVADLPTFDTAEDEVWAGVEGFEASLAFVEEEWERGDYDGVFGFSQGAMMAAMFCAHSWHSKENSKQPRFAILCSGFMRPWPLAASSWWPPRQRLPIPSLHVIGDYDTVVAPCRSEELRDVFQDPVEHRHALVGHPAVFGGHVIPWVGPAGDEAFFEKLSEFLASCCSGPQAAPPDKKARHS